MASKPRLLDLFCGAGGAAMGYHRAGFEVVGVDIAPQPNYPFEFHQGDALVWLLEILSGQDVWHYDAIHTSPPCQHFTKYGNRVKDIKDRYEDLVAPTRELLEETGLPYIIENVEGSPLINPVMLCGSMFDMDIRRHRLFEVNWELKPPTWPCRHKIWEPNRYPGGGWWRKNLTNPSVSRRTPVRGSMEIGCWDIPLEMQKEAMGVDWKIDVRELSEAIPPMYTEFIGDQLLAHLEANASKPSSERRSWMDDEVAHERMTGQHEEFVG